MKNFPCVFFIRNAVLQKYFSILNSAIKNEKSPLFIKEIEFERKIYVPIPNWYQPRLIVSLQCKESFFMKNCCNISNNFIIQFRSPYNSQSNSWWTGKRRYLLFRKCKIYFSSFSTRENALFLLIFFYSNNCNLLKIR